jgi:ABC-2 type transport system ATP-binding protein
VTPAAIQATDDLLLAIPAAGPRAAAPAAAEVVASLSGVRKRLGRTEALAGVDLELRAGELVALLGPNGAGKTTAISLLCGLRSPDAGTVRIFGGDPQHPRTRSRFGVTPQGVSYPGVLKVREVVKLVQAHYPAPAPLAEVLEGFGLDDLASRQIGGLSGGQRRRLGVALAFAGRPSLVLLDEPTTGLDVVAQRAVWNEVRAFVARGGTVLLTTHYLAEAEALASRVVVLNRGKVVADDTVDAVRARVGVTKVLFRAGEPLPELPGVLRTARSGELHTLYTPDPDQLVRDLVRHDVTFQGLEIRPATLEEAFLAVTAEGER